MRRSTRSYPSATSQSIPMGQVLRQPSGRSRLKLLQILSTMIRIYSGAFSYHSPPSRRFLQSH
jgi:hypothetical protein